MILKRVIVLCLALVAAGCGVGDQSEAEAETDLAAQAATSARRCAGPNDLRCPSGQYCKSAAPGKCPGNKVYGVCSSKPQVCIAVYDPVCGCNGKTYGSACEAARAGVAVAHKGTCQPAPIGCSSNADCSSGYCSFSAGTCGPTGTCQPRPQVCPDVYAPVCGCDGTTYGNSCEAASAGASVKQEGACSPPDPCATVLCPPDTICQVEDGKPVCAPAPGEECGPTVCATGKVCCNKSCGICTPPGGVCIQIFCESARR